MTVAEDEDNDDVGCGFKAGSIYSSGGDCSGGM